MRRSSFYPFPVKPGEIPLPYRFGGGRISFLSEYFGALPKMKKSKGQMEAEISNSLIQFEKDYMGRGPKESRTYIIDDLILIRLKGVLTPAEQQLAKNTSGAELIKKVRANLLEQARIFLTETIEKITGVPVISLHTDVSTRTGERVIIFTLQERLEEKLSS